MSVKEKIGLLRAIAPVLCTTVALTGTACGSVDTSAGGEQSTSTSPLPQSAGEQPNWQAGALPGSIPIDDPATAGLAFVPHVPQDLGSPVRIFADDPSDYPPGQRAIAWLFEHPAYGLFVIQERVVPSGAVQREWEEMSAQEAGCHVVPAPPELAEGIGDKDATIHKCNYGTRSLLTLADGRKAFLLEGMVTTGIEWIEPLEITDQKAIASIRAEVGNPDLELGLRILVLGPVDELRGSEAIEIANTL